MQAVDILCRAKGRGNTHSTSGTNASSERRSPGMFMVSLRLATALQLRNVIRSVLIILGVAPSGTLWYGCSCAATTRSAPVGSEWRVCV